MFKYMSTLSEMICAHDLFFLSSLIAITFIVTYIYFIYRRGKIVLYAKEEVILPKIAQTEINVLLGILLSAYGVGI